MMTTTTTTETPSPPHIVTLRDVTSRDGVGCCCIEIGDRRPFIRGDSVAFEESEPHFPDVYDYYSDRILDANAMKCELNEALGNTAYATQ